MQRDRIDSSRAVAPLKPADDARIIDSSEKSIQQVFAEVVKMLNCTP